MDHPWMGRRKDGAYCYLSQPYGLDQETIIEMLVFASRWDLEFHIDTFPAPHFPGSTLSVLWMKRGVLATNGVRRDGLPAL
jgi:hypothetical protein